MTREDAETIATFLVATRRTVPPYLWVDYWIAERNEARAQSLPHTRI